MNRKPFFLVVAAGFVAIAVGACSRQPAEQQSSTAAPLQHYAAIARGEVDVRGGLIRVITPRDGTIATLHGTPGTDVKADELLAALDPTQAKLTQAIARARLDQARAHADALQAKLPDLTQRAQRAEAAAQAGAATGQSADDAKQALSELNAEIAEARAAVEIAKQQLRQADHEVTVRTVRAPVAARVVARNAHRGDIVSAQSGTVLFTLLPNGPRIVRAELNAAFVAKVTPGMRADVVVEGGDGKIYKATVARVGEIFGPSKLIEDVQEASDTRDVECILDLQTDALRVGERVQVRFLYDAPPAH